MLPNHVFIGVKAVVNEDRELADLGKHLRQKFAGVSEIDSPWRTEPLWNQPARTFILAGRMELAKSIE